MNNQTIVSFVKAANPILSAMSYANKLVVARKESEVKGVMLLALMQALNIKDRDEGVFDQNGVAARIVGAITEAEYDVEALKEAHRFIAEVEKLGYITKTNVTVGNKTHTIIKATEAWESFVVEAGMDSKGCALNTSVEAQKSFRVSRGVKAQSVATMNVMQEIASVKFSIFHEVVAVMSAVLPSYEVAVKEAAKDKKKSAQAKVNEIKAVIHTSSTMKDTQFTFNYFLDSRGRSYSEADSVNIQGSDITRAAIKPVYSEVVSASNEHRFIELANAYSELDLSAEDVFKCGIAPVETHSIWANSDKPMMFINVAMTYAQWKLNPEAPVALFYGLDGKNNGCQHLTAMAKSGCVADMLGMMTTKAKNDLYETVGLSFVDGLSTDLKKELKKLAKKCKTNLSDVKWIRKLAKPVVMTYSYSKTESGAGDDVVSFVRKASFLMKKGGKQGLSTTTCRNLGRELHRACTATLSDLHAVMEWIQDSITTIAGKGNKQVQWTTPDGFIASQNYVKLDLVRSSIQVDGKQIKFSHEIPALGKDGKQLVNLSKHKSGSAANVVHSFDACHMRMAARKVVAKGLPFVAIHDEFMTHINHVDFLYTSIVEAFVEMYSNDVLSDLKAQWEAAYDVILPSVPVANTWEITTLNNCNNFFE